MGKLSNHIYKVRAQEKVSRGEYKGCYFLPTRLTDKTKIRKFAMSVEGLVGPCCNTKSIESHDMTKY